MLSSKPVWFALCGLLALLLPPADSLAATPGSKILVPTTTSPRRWPDVAYDAQNNVYLAVIGSGTIQGRFLSPSGTLLAGPLGTGTFIINTIVDYQQSPRVACGAGVCAVFWGQGSPVTPMVRLVSYTTGFVGQPFSVFATAGMSTEVGHGISFGDNEFVPAWTHNGSVKFARISLAGQLLQSAVLPAAAGWKSGAHTVYNPTLDEVVLSFAGTKTINGIADTAFVSVQRMKNGSLLGGVIDLVTGGSTYLPHGEFNPTTGSVLVAYYKSAKFYGRAVGAGGALGAATLLSSSAAYDAIDLAYNTNANRFLLVTHGQDVEDIAIEITPALVPSPYFTLTSNGGTGNYNPRVVSHATEAQWLAVTSNGFKSLWAQFAVGSTCTSNCGGNEPPPPPPPSCTYGLSASAGSVSSTGGTGAITVTTNTSPCSWVVVSGAAWLTASPGSGTTTGNVTWTAQANGTDASRSATLTIAGQVFTVTQSVGGLALQFDEGGYGDVLAYTPSNGTWSTYLGQGSGLVAGPSGTWLSGWKIQTARFNGDDLADFFYYNAATGNWRKGINTGGALDIYGGTWATGWEATVIDLNGDGLTDVFVHNATTGAWSKCIASSIEGFTCSAGSPVWAPGWKVYPAKFNSDAYGDLFLYNTSAEFGGLWFKVLGQAGSGLTYVAGDLRWAADWQLTPGDFDGDGFTDLLLYRTSDGLVFRVKFTATSATYLGSQWGTTWTMQKGDFNGDRKTDLLLYDPSSTDGRWAVGLSNTAGWFNFYYPVVGAGLGWTPYVGHLDADAKADVLWYHATSGATVAWYATTPGSFQYAVGPTIQAGADLLLSPPALP